MVVAVHVVEMGGCHGTEWGRGLQPMPGVEGWAGARPIGEASWCHPRGHEVEFGDAREGQWGQVSLEFVEGVIGSSRLAHLSQPMEVKLVGVALAMDLGHDVLVVVVAQCPAQLVIIHVGFALPLAPAPRHLIGVDQLEFPVRAFPGDAVQVGPV